MTNQAIIRITRTVSATYLEKPSVKEIAKLKAAGATYKNGQWFKSEGDSALVDEAEVGKHFGA